MSVKFKLFFDSIKSLCCIISMWCLLLKPVWAIEINGQSYNTPAGYTMLDYATFDGATYVNTGITSYTSTGKFDITLLKTASGTTFVTAENPESSSNNIGLFTSGSGYNVQNGANTRTILTVDTTNFHNILIESDGYTLDGSKTIITPVTEFTITSPLYIGTGTNSRSGNGAPDTRYFKGSIRHLYHYKSDGTADFLGIPMKDGNNVVGFYDFVSKSFKIPVSGTLTAGPVAEIQIATTKYVEEAFADSVSELNTTMGTIKDVVDNTIIQADRIGKLATGKQNRPAENCPDGAQCLLITEPDGSLHWYPICNADGSVGT